MGLVMSFQSINKNAFVRFCLIGMMSFVLVACGGGGEGSETESASNTGNASSSSTAGPETSTPEESTSAPEENAEEPSNVGSNEGSNQGGSEEPVDEVVPVRTSVSLNWGIPLEREDGSDLELYEINGYVIAYGTDANNLDTEVTVIGAGETSLVIEDLIPDTYFFAIATIDSDGLQGAFSGAVQKEVI